MREIKFREWNPDTKTMCHVDILNCRNEMKYLMQYIGAKDKNGVEIYEGDVIRENAGEKYRDYVVRWSDGKCGFIADTKALCKVFPCLNQGTAKYLEVVGNIYENPELVSNETDT